jgi:UDP-N-acetylmuramyl pentapeptide phosphotransferase/UDP-N-acetylglucosamine-1-phosphate transferase
MFEALLFVAGTGLAWLLVYGMLRWAWRLRLLDVPNERSLHTHATPRGGGAAIAAICLVGISLGAAFGIRPDSLAFGGYLAGALLIVAVSLVDDVSQLSAGIRLTAHLIAAALMVAGLGFTPPFGGGPTWIAWLEFGGALLWTVGLTNAYNFMDGIDGMAACQAVVAGLCWTLLGALIDLPWLVLLGLLIAASSTGFLVHNWPPAKIFMGDVGSAFLGFTFAFMPLAEVHKMPRVSLVGALLFLPFIFDTVLTMVRRFLLGENIFLAHRSHLYQRLVLAGWSQASVTLSFGLSALVMAGLGTLWLVADSRAVSYSLILAVVLVPAGLWILVVRAERHAAGSRDVRPLLGRGR